MDLQGNDENGSLTYGILLEGKAAVRATGFGNVNLTGDGGDTGIAAADNSQVQAVDGNLQLAGRASGADSTSYSIDLEGNALLQTTGIGNISLVQDGFKGSGITFVGNTFTKTAPNVSLVSGGDITLTADTIDLGSANSIRTTGDGTLTFQPSHVTAPIVLGGDHDVGRALIFTRTDLAAIAPGFRELIIGDALGLGQITTQSDLTFNCDVLLQSPNDFDFSGGMLISNTLDVGINNLTLVSGGSIALTHGAQLLSTGGNITITGRGSDGSSNSGVVLDEATVNAGTGNVHITGAGNLVINNADGIVLQNAQIVVNGSGNVPLNGSAENGYFSHGIIMKREYAPNRGRQPDAEWHGKRGVRQRSDDQRRHHDTGRRFRQCHADRHGLLRLQVRPGSHYWR